MSARPRKAEPVIGAAGDVGTPAIAGDETTPRAKDGAPMPESRWEKLAANLKTIGGAVLLAMVIRTCLFEAFEIEGPSMEPSLLNGDRVVVAKFLYGLFLPLRDAAEVSWGEPEVGDVVIIKSPADGVDIVKRVIGVGGDRIEFHGEQVVRNGIPLSRVDRGRCRTGIGAAHPTCHVYASELDGQEFLTSSARPTFGGDPATVPPGHIYVLGDHRDSSNDSRNPAVGLIPVARVKGRALSIYWSNGGEGLRWSRMFRSVR